MRASAEKVLKAEFLGRALKKPEAFGKSNVFGVSRSLKNISKTLT